MPDEKEGAPEASGESGRRGFVVLAAAGTCAIAAGVGIPAALFVTAPLRAAGASGQRYVVSKLEELEVGVPKKVPIVGDQIDAWTRATDRRLGAVWLLRTGPKEVRALSVVCPHLGCGVEVTIEGGKPKGFGCPCHDSTFDLNGERVAGPSPRAMDALPVEITDEGDVAVTFKRFRAGVDQPEELAG